MNAYEYRKTLTSKQADAFWDLYQKNLRDAGWYQKNSDINNAVSELRAEARREIQAEFDALELEHRTRRAEIRAKISELHALEDALNKEEDALNKEIDERNTELWGKANETVRDEVQALIDARGDADKEEEIIQALTIAEYSKRLAKKNKAVA